MLPKLPEPGTAVDWLRHARSDLALARVPATPDILREALCYHARQAAGKSIKAVLIGRGIAFPRTHNLKILLELLPPTCPIPQAVMQPAALTDYAVITRYPGQYEPVAEEEHLNALALADAVLAWAESVI